MDQLRGGGERQSQEGLPGFCMDNWMDSDDMKRDGKSSIESQGYIYL